MMLSTDLMFLFFAIPRTGSRAVQRWLFYEYGAVDTFDHWGRQYGHHATTVPSDFPLENFFRFTIVRHPLDRLISLYHRWCGRDPWKKNSFLSFDQFVLQYGKRSLSSRRYRRRLWPGYLGQREFIEKLPLPLDTVLRYETLVEGLAGLPFTDKFVVLPIFKPSKRKPFEWYYANSETLQRALEICRKDTEWFGYQ